MIFERDSLTARSPMLSFITDDTRKLEKHYPGMEVKVGQSQSMKGRKRNMQKSVALKFSGTFQQRQPQKYVVTQSQQINRSFEQNST